MSRYTRMDLTLSCDKLVAISGIAKSTQLWTASEYRAGIWLNSLPLSLLWIADSDKSSYPGQYRAPFWSWALLDRPVFRFDSRKQRVDPNFGNIECSVIPLVEGEDMGEVKDGYIIVCTKLASRDITEVFHNSFNYDYFPATPPRYYRRTDYFSPDRFRNIIKLYFLDVKTSETKSGFYI